MVLDHVADHAGLIVVFGSVADAHAFGHGDLHAADVGLVPQGMEDLVGKTQGQEVLHGLLAEVVVNAVDLALLEHLVQALGQGTGAFQVAAVGLFHHQSAPFPGQVEAQTTQFLGHRGKGGGRQGQVKHPEGRGVKGGFQVGHPAAEALPIFGGLGPKGYVAGVASPLSGLIAVDTGGHQGLGHEIPVRIVVKPVAPGYSQEPPALEFRFPGDAEKSGQKFPPGQVAVAAEDHKEEGSHAFSERRRTRWPPNWFRSAATTRAAKESSRRE